VTARLSVLLGAGGVGKTTLAAGHAIALARAGGRVGLLGIDPARRLQGALGVTLGDVEAAVALPGPGAGELHAALLSPADCMRRWSAEACPDPEARARLFANPFFVALADRLATSTDVLAAVRIAEWAERDPALTDLVVDTAPGLNAVEFLRRPESLTAFLEGRLVGWLRAIGRGGGGGAFGAVLRGVARRTLGGIARIAGTRVILELADLLSLIEGVLEQMLARLERAQRTLRDPSTEILLVAAVRDDAAHVAEQLAAALGAVGLRPRATVVNRALPPALDAELAAIPPAAIPPEAAAVVRYARAQAAMERRVIAAVAPLGPVAVVPSVRGLDEDGRLDALALLGERLAGALASPAIAHVGGWGPGPMRGRT
jgi:anion-transporting  ArsA/GET3 family ATPase